MADDHLQRPFRNSDLPSRATPTANNPPTGPNDPLAELARLIGQNDPFGEFGRDSARRTAAPQGGQFVRGLAAHIPPHDPYLAQAAAVPPDTVHGDEDLARQPYGGPSPAGGGDVDESHEPAPGYEDHPAGMSAYEDASYDPNLPPYVGEDQDFYDDIPPPRRRTSVLAIAAVFGLAVVGTAGAFGYRALFGSVGSGPPPVIKADSKPVKIVPDKAKGESAKLINDRINDHSGDQKLVSREEQPVDLDNNTQAAMVTKEQAVAGAGSTQAPALGSGVIGSDPKKIHTITIRPDQPAAADATSATPPLQANVAAAMPEPPVAAPGPAQPMAHEGASPPPPKSAPAPRQVVTHHPAPAPAPRHIANAPLSLTPDSVASMRTASTASRPAAHPPTRLAPSASRPAASAGGGYAVQVSSRRSEADAQAAMHRMQSKFASVIGAQPVMVRRVDLGAKGVYYRAMVGPFGSSDEASKLCGRLKAAGGSCFVQRI